MRHLVPRLRFLGKTLLCLVTPGGFGYYRRLRRERRRRYVHERDMHPIRRKLCDGTWSLTRGSIRRRDYDSYDEYVSHQQQKLEEILKLAGGFSNRVVARWRVKFYRRFRHLLDLVPRDAVIVCLGARQGTEIEVLRDLGFTAAYGIDLNPGPDNPYVRTGDFHALDEPDDSVDVLYSNCVDHAFDLDRFFAEHARVLRADGYALYDLSLSGGGGGSPFETVQWGSPGEVVELMLKHFGEVVRDETEKAWRWVLLRSKKRAAAR